MIGLQSLYLFKMRIRQLSTFLSDAKHRQKTKLEELRGIRLGIDALSWLRSLSKLKDPYLSIIGGLPLSLFPVIEHQLSLFKKFDIEPFFVFDGIQSPTHNMFVAQIPTSFAEGWNNYAIGEIESAEWKFSHATSRCTTDTVSMVLQFLRSKDVQCLRAPYFSCPQLHYCLEKKIVNAVFGPPALFLYGVKQVILNIHWDDGVASWIDFRTLLETCNWPSKNQFFDACLLAGTEFNYTYPYLDNFAPKEVVGVAGQQFAPDGNSVSNAVHFGNNANNNVEKENTLFHFEATIDLLKKNSMPILFQRINTPDYLQYPMYIQTFSDCRALIEFPVILQLGRKDQTSPIVDFPEDVRRMVPTNFQKVLGYQFHGAVYLLMANGLISRKLPTVLAFGEWLDRAHPAVVAMEYYEALYDIREYRRRALGLIALRLPSIFRETPILFSPLPSFCLSDPNESPSVSINIDCSTFKLWSFTALDVKQEMERQGCKKINWKFALGWYTHCLQRGMSLYDKGIENPTFWPNLANHDLQSIIALVYFMLLDNLGYIAADGRMTVFGLVLLDVADDFQWKSSQYNEVSNLIGDAFISLELMKFGMLMGDPLVINEDVTYQKFPQLIKTIEAKRKGAAATQLLLLSRVMSLYPMQLHPKLFKWLANVDFDLAGYHSVVKVLMRGLNSLSEACLANILLKDISKISIIPPHLFRPDAPLLPVFYQRHNCMGIVAKFFLEYPNSLDQKYMSQINVEFLTHIGGLGNSNPELRKLSVFEKIMQAHFKNCVDPVSDLCHAIKFWFKQYNLIVAVNNGGSDVNELKENMERCTDLLKYQISFVSLHQHASFPKEIDL
ncbi:XPG N-terminal domain-containing protein [Cardiosporidium cionae]|uniref:XPG N-terminal domain-containing protein n=1 Tax=Cardiosporidium cionae TaxID=476202 RepID=A0ABQ7JA22_9APIC|nr:XPG N-terminal domain-containing protein [Cardiosporidium cionae]|eukprot:KAF8820827.1 XPG N-terminal domain-containing protein [Cardiosporidium cionae]